MASRTKAASKASRQVDEQLARYRAMRDFHVTAEPSGNSKSKARAAAELPFVVQKHAATRLHYDFRLGWKGVLKSWAVTRGPSFFTGDKRLAVEVEDHPIEYAGFEGTIPKGQYGGGTVMVWDFGDWKPLVDVERGLREGNLKFELRGKKLKGAWALVRMKGRNERPDKPNWLLIKERDEFARAETDPPIIDIAENSAVTNRSMDEIAASGDHVWHSVDRDERQSQPKPASAPGSRSAPTEPGVPVIRKVKRRGHEAAQIVKDAPREPFPGFIAPELAEQTTAAPDDKTWIHELKLDGYRVQIHVRATKKNGRIVREARLFTRKGLDWTHRMPDIAQAAAGLPVTDAVLDGEAVVLNESGIPDFGALQAAFQEDKNRYISYFGFDLLHIDGHNLRDLPLLERKRVLAGLLGGDRKGTPLRLSEHFEVKGSEVLAKACALGAEGIVSKLSASTYQSGRTSAWRKVKCTLDQEFVVIGFTAPSKGGHGIGALLLGYYEKGKLCYAGRAGTGFTQKTSGDLRTQLNKLVEKTSRLERIPADARRGVFWVKPELVAQVVFAEWTKDNLVRQAAFKGLREDKPANEVERERAVPIKRAGVEARQNATEPGIRKKKVLRAEQPAQSATSLPITHPGKILDATSGLTKQMLAEYYLAVAERMLPHVAGRPLSIVRCPDGIGGQDFFQKHTGLGMPEGVKSVPVPNRKTGKREEFLTIDSPEGLVGFAQMGVLEIHPWGSRNESIEQPDRVIFDLDPDEAIPWKALAGAAKELRTRLKQLGLASFLKHTGGKGLHVVVPIQAQNTWPIVKEFAHCIVLQMEKEQPDIYVTKMTKAVRKGRIYLDYLRNEREATSIGPFSPRARVGAPAAVTMAWSELESQAAPSYRVADFAQWRARLNRDPWKEMDQTRQGLTAEMLSKAGVRIKN